MKTLRFWRLAALSLVLVLGVSSRAAADSPLPRAITHQHWNGYEALLQQSDAAPGESQYKNPPSPICTTPTSTAANVNTDCEGVAPHNETTIAVNPTNPLNIVGSANDYQLGPTETIFSRAHVSFDGGKTWTTVPVNDNGYVATGDPAVAFDAAGNAYLATLGFGFGQGSPTGKDPDLIVSSSSDGGSTWSDPVRVAKGTGSFGSVGIFNDKEYITAWGNGNAIVTWSRFNDLKGGAYGGSPIFATVTHDGGQTWTTGQEVSGSAPFCVGFAGGTSCDQDQASTPVVAVDGSIYVSFINEFDLTTGRDQYLVVKVDPQTGARIAGPFLVARLVDGVTDYPFNAFGSPTYQDSQFRTWSPGSLAADPTNPAHLAVTWSDMRNSQLPAPSDPYAAKTNSDVGVAQSFDGGQTWSAPTILTIPGDQFMPWAAYDSSGSLRIGYFDRSVDPANHAFGYSLATERRPGTLRFSTQLLTTALSNPTQGDRWFSGLTVNPAFPHPSSFIGDYSGIASSPSGGVAALWTDMRLNVCFGTRCGAGEDAFYASAH